MPRTDEQSTARFTGKEDVIRGILQRELSGRSLRTAAVKADNRPLFVAAIRYFRIWGNALRAAGVDVEAVSGRRVWTADRVLQLIQKAGSEGLALNEGAVRDADQGLVLAARKLWGSWDEALQAAGYDPADIRLQRHPWTKSQIIAAIQSQAADGAPLTQNSIRPESVRFAAKRLFGSFDAAVRVAGLGHLLTKHPRWSRKRIVKAIQARRQTGQPVNCLAVVNSDSRLYDAARRYLGGWPSALRAAGIDPDSVRGKPHPWTPKTVIRELRRRAATGQPATCISSIRPVSLVRACITFFGSLEEAAAAAKVDPAKIGYRRGQGNHRRRVRGNAHARQG